jgi:hypothetical protein
MNVGYSKVTHMMENFSADMSAAVAPQNKSTSHATSAVHQHYGTSIQSLAAA